MHVCVHSRCHISVRWQLAAPAASARACTVACKVCQGADLHPCCMSGLHAASTAQTATHSNARQGCSSTFQRQGDCMGSKHPDSPFGLRSKLYAPLLPRPGHMMIGWWCVAGTLSTCVLHKARHNIAPIHHSMLWIVQEAQHTSA